MFRANLLVQSNDFIREIWAPRPLITAGGYTRDLALEVAETKGDLIGFGRPFIPNVRECSVRSEIYAHSVFFAAGSALTTEEEPSVGRV